MEEDADLTPDPEADATDATGAPAGAENTDTRIPKARFDQVIAERNLLRAEMEQVRAQLDAMEAPEPKPKPANGEQDVRPPSNLTDVQRVQWYVDHFGKQLIERELGMDLGSVKALLGTTRTTSQDVMQRRWSEGCSSLGLDPEDKDLQTYVHGCVTTRKQPLDEALKNAARFFKRTPADPAPDNVVPFLGGASGNVADSGVFARTKAEAIALAAKGKRAQHQTIEEILAAAAAKR